MVTRQIDTCITSFLTKFDLLCIDNHVMSKINYDAKPAVQDLPSIKVDKFSIML